MEIKRFSDFIICPIPAESELDQAEIEQIVTHTHNTWQHDRPIQEIRENTIQGKRAEIVIENILRDNSTSRFLAYDKMRRDNFNKHAPFDGIIYRNDITTKILQSAIDRINNDVITLEKVYGIKDVLHLHGGIPSCCEIAPIMGHGNKYIIDSYRRKAKEAQEEYVEWYESICNAIADFCESLYKDTDAIISENDDFFSALWDVNQVVCLGLSFGDVDVPYLDRIEYEVRPETKWLVYYHSDEDLKRLKSVFGITGISRKFEVYFRKSDNFWDTNLYSGRAINAVRIS